MNTTIQNLFDKYNVTLEAKFVPASSRKDEWQKTAVNFDVTLRINGKTVYHGPYAYGVGHLPGYRHDRANILYWEPSITNAIERGVWPRGGLQNYVSPLVEKVSDPKLEDVVSSLIWDARAIDFGSFEEWCVELGYDTDSRAAENIFNECVKTGLAIRAAISDNGILEFRQAFEDY